MSNDRKESALSDHLAALRDAMDREGFDLLLITDPADIAWVTGFRFNPWEHLAALAVPHSDSVRFLFPGYEEAGGARAVPDETQLFMFPEVGGDADAFRGFVDGLSAHSRIAVNQGTMSVEHHERLRDAIGGDDFGDCSPFVGDLRAVKDAEEIELIAEASRIADRAVERMIADWLKPGAVEAKLGGELSRILRLEGADGSAFEPNVTAGWRSALPHGPDHSREAGTKPGQDAIQAGELLIFDFSVVVGGYTTDISRTYVLGESEAKQQEIFDVVREAELAAIEACVAGNEAGEPDRIAKRIITDAGYGDCSPQKTGHGVGIELHELPFVASTSTQELKPGMTFAIEPAIYLKGYGGARIEDVVVVQDDGPPKILTDISAQDGSLELAV